MGPVQQPSENEIMPPPQQPLLQIGSMDDLYAYWNSIAGKGKTVRIDDLQCGWPQCLSEILPHAKCNKLHMPWHRGRASEVCLPAKVPVQGPSQGLSQDN